MYPEISSSEALIKWQVANANVDRLEKDKEHLTAESNTLEKNINDYNGAKILLEHLKNYKLEKRKDFILTIINSALKDIFQADYILDIQPRDNKGKSASGTQKYDIIFFQNSIEIARNDDLLTSNGGGVLSIASLFFKILIGYLYSKNKFYIFDEALSQVSPQYRERLSKFLRTFCEEYGFTIIVVSQTEELETGAHLVYEVQSDVDKNKVPVLSIKEVHGDYPTEDFFYSKLKNFQSIVDQTFIYKGFTIIRGPNNSGKSATLRAIDALLFNNFKTEIYPRKNPGGSKLTTEITFGFQGKSDQEPREIGLKYKSGKVMFIVEGEEYYGKSLAADKLKEAVEEIGFRYIDVKKMYKNFKGALKEQTERIAYTNQYDGLFLIGAKTSDSEKIFSFLFNTENIALAIAQSKEVMLEYNKEYNGRQHRLQEVETDLNQANINVSYYINLYYLLLIKEYKICQSSISKLREDSKMIIDLISNMEKYIEVSSSTEFLQGIQYDISILRNKEEYNNIQMDTISQLIDVIKKLNSIKEYLDLENIRQKYSYKIYNIDQIVPAMYGLLQLNYFYELGSKIDDYKVWLENNYTQTRELDTEYNLCECDSCKGLGVQVS